MGAPSPPPPPDSTAPAGILIPRDPRVKLAALDIAAISPAPYPKAARPEHTGLGADLGYFGDTIFNSSTLFRALLKRTEPHLTLARGNLRSLQAFTWSMLGWLSLYSFCLNTLI